MGIYSELTKGEIAGFETGLTSDQSLWLHAQSFDHTGLESQYLIGFGAGFVEGQSYRKRLKESPCSIFFEDNVELYLFFTQYRRHHKAFKDISKESALEHEALWQYYALPQKICAQSLELLKLQKLQRALDIIHNYYATHFHLAAWRSFEQITQLLVQIRAGKKTGTVTPEVRAQQRIELEQRLRSWIDKYSV